MRLNEMVSNTRQHIGRKKRQEVGINERKLAHNTGGERNPKNETKCSRAGYLTKVRTQSCVHKLFWLQNLDSLPKVLK